MKNRKVEKVLASQGYNWVGDGFYVTSFIGHEIPRSRMSPFLVLDYNPEVEFEPRAVPRGVGAHPHKGFETVTMAYKGRVEHKDSRGNHGVIREGDVQWMTAGSGILHQEFHEEGFAKTGGSFQMVQMWVNLPAKYKEVTPGYQDIRFDEMTRVAIDDKSFVNVIAGSYQGQAGKATTFSPVHLYNAYLNHGVTADFTFPANYNTALLVVRGGVTINDEQTLTHGNFAMFENGGGDTFNVRATSDDTIVLVMSGEPLNEPIAHYGPFVMNTTQQLEQAFRDFQAGKFGVL